MAFRDAHGNWITDEQQQRINLAGQMPQANLTNHPRTPEIDWPSRGGSPVRGGRVQEAPRQSGAARYAAVKADIQGKIHQKYEDEQFDRKVQGLPEESYVAWGRRTGWVSEFEVAEIKAAEAARNNPPAPVQTGAPSPAPARAGRSRVSLKVSLAALAVVIGGGYAYLHMSRPQPVASAVLQPAAHIQPQPLPHHHRHHHRR